MNYTAIILAGGKSKRFGRDKTALELNGKLIIEIIAERCRDVFSEVLIAGGSKLDFDLPGVRVVPDTFLGAGPLGGIHAGVLAASNETCFVTACDMPNFDLNSAKKLLDASAGFDGSMFKHGGRAEPLFAVYKKSILPHAEALLFQGSNKIMLLESRLRFCFLEHGSEKHKPEHSLFFNINYEDDYKLISGGKTKNDKDSL